jgi:hypothetical protein
MKILKNSVVNPLSACLLFALGGGGIGLITYVTYATSCTNSTPAPTPTQLEPIPFTDEYFT